MGCSWLRPEPCNIHSETTQQRQAHSCSAVLQTGRAHLGSWQLGLLAAVVFNQCGLGEAEQRATAPCTLLVSLHTVMHLDCSVHVRASQALRAATARKFLATGPGVRPFAYLPVLLLLLLSTIAMCCRCLVLSTCCCWPHS
jgi:hypothetical protein